MSPTSAAAQGVSTLILPTKLSSPNVQLTCLDRLWGWSSFPAYVDDLILCRLW